MRVSVVCAKERKLTSYAVQDGIKYTHPQAAFALSFLVDSFIAEKGQRGLKKHTWPTISPSVLNMGVNNMAIILLQMAHNVRVLFFVDIFVVNR